MGRCEPMGQQGLRDRPVQRLLCSGHGSPPHPGPGRLMSMASFMSAPTSGFQRRRGHVFTQPRSARPQEVNISVVSDNQKPKWAREGDTSKPFSRAAPADRHTLCPGLDSRGRGKNNPVSVPPECTHRHPPGQTARRGGQGFHGLV